MSSIDYGTPSYASDPQSRLVALERLLEQLQLRRTRTDSFAEAEELDTRISTIQVQIANLRTRVGGSA